MLNAHDGAIGYYEKRKEGAMNDPALIQAVGEVLDAFDQGVFVRSTCFDGRPDWAIKIVKPLASLAKLRQLYLEDETT